MKYALISDIHGNLEALEAVLADIRSEQADKIFCLGDVVGYGSNPKECLKLVLKKCECTLMGNHEFAAMGLIDVRQLNRIAGDSAEWTREQLTDKDIAKMADLPMETAIDDALLVHASPHEPENWHYILSVPQAKQAFAAFDSALCFFGHSHVPMVFRLQDDGDCSSKSGHDFTLEDGCRYLVNIGSVGQPRDNDPRACYVMYDSEEQSVNYRRVEYDIAKTQQKMLDANIHKMLVDRLVMGR